MKYLVEYLPRINCVGVHIDEVKAVILEGMTPKELIIRYHSDVLSDRMDMIIKLPKVIDVNQNRGVTFVKGAENNWSLRLKVDPTQPSNMQGSLDLDDISNTTLNKWNREFLNCLDTFSFRCGHCEAPILDNRVNCKVLHDMPSDNWMELMDYWHCSKPDPHNIKEGTFASMSASRYSSLKPLVNEVLISGSYLSIIYETITERVIEQKDKTLVCYNCANILGEKTSDGLCRLYKWKLQLFNMITEKIDTYDAKNDIILTIVNYTKNYSGRYINLKCKGHKDIMLWIFALDIGVTLSNSVVYSEAIKVLYITDESHFSIVRKNHNVEDFNVKELPFEEFLTELKENHQHLPKSAKTFNSWQISYLPLV